MRPCRHGGGCPHWTPVRHGNTADTKGCTVTNPIKEAQAALDLYARAPVLHGLKTPNVRAVAPGLYEALAQVLHMCDSASGLPSDAVAEAISIALRENER